MKVLIVSGMYPTSRRPWTGIFIHRQVVELRALGVEVEVVVPSPILFSRFAGRIRRGEIPRNFSRRRIDGVPVTYLPYWHVPLRLSATLEAVSLTTALRRYACSNPSNNGTDVVHGHGLFPTGYASMRLARELGVPSVVSARGSDVHTHPRTNRGIARYTAATIVGADRIIAVSRALAQGIRDLATPAQSIEVVYNGVDADYFRRCSDKGRLRSRLGLPEVGVGLCTVSRLVREKGLLELVQAFHILCSKHENLWLSVVGDGPLHEVLVRKLRQQQSRGRVVFAGSVPHADVGDWLNAADIFVLASYNEGLPNAVLEAMACRLPIVATCVGGIPEAVSDGVVGWLIPRSEVAPLVEGLSKLIDSPVLRRCMGDAAYDRARTEFSWERSARAVVRVYHQVRERTDNRLW